jgi:hypothetical protein
MFQKPLALIKNLSQPSHLWIVLRDLFRRDNKIYADGVHLQAAMEWLSTAQDVTECGGVSAGYFFPTGWLPPYPETTGYIIPTLLKYASLSRDGSYTERAMKMGDWEIEVQLSSGAVRGGAGISGGPIVFDTGQVILGWASLYKETKLIRFLDAAIKAADWLVSIQDGDGKWTRYTYMVQPHTYNTRVAWALLKVYELTNKEEYKTAAEKQILWALTHAKENGWFSLMSFTANETPFTHTIAYTLSGLLESASYLGEEGRQKILHIVQKASENIMMTYESQQKATQAMPRYLHATLNEEWKSKDNYSCLTGNAQLAIVFLKLNAMNNNTQFLRTALNLIDQLKARQSLDCRNPGIRGGIPGSYPIWGKYAILSYPNWAAKFFVDALILKQEQTSYEMD